jgi:hypothetical protein
MRKAPAYQKTDKECADAPAIEPFPEPRTYPSGWDMSNLFPGVLNFDSVHLNPPESTTHPEFAGE